MGIVVVGGGGVPTGSGTGGVGVELSLPLTVIVKAPVLSAVYVSQTPKVSFWGLTPTEIVNC